MSWREDQERRFDELLRARIEADIKRAAYGKSPNPPDGNVRYEPPGAGPTITTSYRVKRKSDEV